MIIMRIIKTSLEQADLQLHLRWVTEHQENKLITWIDEEIEIKTKGLTGPMSCLVMSR